jgi:hippurate hydrolase
MRLSEAAEGWLAAHYDDVVTWRRRIHANPELGRQEFGTTQFVATHLADAGLNPKVLPGGTGLICDFGPEHGPRIALRADMDALPIEEKNGFVHASQHHGRVHACGHDGHTAMLLGAAKYLAEPRTFTGTVQLIFQPAEENEGGARLMVEEGLLERYPVEAIYGMHNWPGLPAGEFAIRPGPMMAAFDIFEIVVGGRGAHAAMPHLGIDPVVTAAQIVAGLQTIASRNINPLQGAVVSVTQIHGGDTWNVIPDEVVLRGTTRSFDPAVRDALEPAIRRVAEGTCAGLGASMTMRYERRYPPTLNSPAETEIAAATAAALVGPDKVRRDLLPSMGAEDFACFLEKKPGAYIWIGNGAAADQAMLHNPHYDFNDEILALGASYWARLAETVLAGG